MTEEELILINKYCSPFSLLVANKEGNIVRLHCPFKVIALVDLEFIPKGKIVEVDQVLITMEVNLVYLVKDKGYRYFHFSIVGQ